jgi:hypothetical protein
MCKVIELVKKGHGQFLKRRGLWGADRHAH